MTAGTVHEKIAFFRCHSTEFDRTSPAFQKIPAIFSLNLCTKQVFYSNDGSSDLRSSKRSVNIYLTTWPYIPADSDLHSQHLDNSKFRLLTCGELRVCRVYQTRLNAVPRDFYYSSVKLFSYSGKNRDRKRLGKTSWVQYLYLSGWKRQHTGGNYIINVT